MRFQGKRCVACGWVSCSGFITFMKKVHEPHCLSCLSDWEKVLRSLKGAAIWIGLGVFRDWQRERAQKMGVPA